MKNTNEFERNRTKSPRYFVECGCCGMFHRADFWGDCRDDNNRFSLDELPKDAEVLELEDK